LLRSVVRVSNFGEQVTYFTPSLSNGYSFNMNLKGSAILVLFLFSQNLLQDVGSSLPLQLTPDDIQPKLWRPMPITRIKDGSTNARLPNAVIPVHYKLDLIPILEPTDADFLKAPGHVTITVNCTEETREVTLHLHEIEVDTASVTVIQRLLSHIIIQSILQG